MDRRHWSFLLVAVLLIGLLSLLFFEVDVDLEESVNPNASSEAKAVSTELGE